MKFSYISILCLLSSCDCFLYKTYYYHQKVDHFSFTNNAIYKQRYLLSDQFWKPKGPIFFYTGNEGDIEWFCNNTGFMWDIAPQYHAMLVFAEHRYYGKSLPFGKQSFSEPKYTGYLSSEQALADFAQLIYNLKRKTKGLEDSAVIAFGGSYGGMLSAWFRMKYPHIVDGAIAASAPVAQFTGLTPCQVYNKIVTEDFKQASKSCADNIRHSWKELDKMGSTEEGRSWISSAWRLCNPLSSQSDVIKLKEWIVDALGNTAMMNYPYPTNFMANLPANPVKAMCKYLKGDNLSGKGLLSAVYAALNVYYNYDGKQKCLNIQPNDDSVGETGWDYQSCTEMVMPMCSNGVTDMFYPNSWNFTNFALSCKKKWKVVPQENMAAIMYGGRNLKAASNIVFSNGLLDPWSGGGILKNVSNSVITVIIPEGAHHLDLRSSNSKDPASVINARNLEKKMISRWIQK